MFRKNTIIISGALMILVLLIGTGLVFQKSEAEKINGLSSSYDVSEQFLSYVKYDHGKPNLYLYHIEDRTKEKLVEFAIDQVIVDPTFSHDGKRLTFIVRNKNSEEDESSMIYQYDVTTKESKELFHTENLITELAFSPNDDLLYYLRAGTYTNYSPIAGKRPHEFDIFSYDLANDQHRQITNLQKYAMNSLQVSLDGKLLFVQMDDDFAAETADDIFAMRQKIFQIPLDAPNELSVLFDSSREVDIYDFTITPDGEEIIYQSISNPDTGSTFIYELYSLNFATREEKQLTNVNIYCEKPTVSKDGKTVYFIVDKRFGKGGEDFHLYQIDRETGQLTEIENL